MDTNGKLAEMLARSVEFQHYERAFNEALGLPVTLRPTESWQLPFRGRHRENKFCALMAGKSRTCASCLQMQGRLGQQARHGPVTMTCAYGLSETAVPVRMGSQAVALLQSGQVLRFPPAEESFAPVARLLEAHGCPDKIAPARAAYFRTPVLSARRLRSVTELLGLFAEHLSIKANQIAIQQEHTEIPCISRARQFISEHYMETLKLAAVARQVNVSVFHFCKLFHKATGLTFTEYLSRVRIERAKGFLLNQHLRIGEIADQSGFQSLTHFNRTFKRLTGQSPSGFRASLPKPAISHETKH